MFNYRKRMMPNDQLTFELAVPPAASTIEALRGIGYDVRTAIADLVDNSISADARNIWITFHWSGIQSWATIVDDGRGMSESELANAMRLGSSSPLIQRGVDDLGRFGLGMKTASFSQCRRITVATKKAPAQLAVRRWDLDYVSSTNEWRLLRNAATESTSKLRVLDRLEHGTVVLWELMDQLVDNVDVDDANARAHFQQTADAVREHLGVVFHRFLARRGPAQPQVAMFVNGMERENQVEAWDPFLEDNASTIQTPAEVIRFGGDRLEVQGFILPHKDRLSESEYHAAAGPAGWNAQQGFYVYRQKRLLVAGSWLGLGNERAWSKEEHFKLARIRLDIPNSTDALWQIDVRKSVARPPRAVKKRLRNLAEDVRRQAREVFSYRGQYQPRILAETIVRAWSPESRAGRHSYRINRDHPIIRQALSKDCISVKDILRVFNIVEATVPVQKIWLDEAEHPDGQTPLRESLPTDVVRDVLEVVYSALRTTRGLTHDGAVHELLVSEPFNSYPELVYSLADH
jgi:hypothetical protein